MAKVLLIYSLISGVILTLLWAVFRLAGINRLTCHRLNRLLLIAILVASICLPFIAFVEPKVASATGNIELADMVGVIEIAGAPAAAEPSFLSRVEGFLPAIYIAGLAVSVAWLLVALAGVAWAIIKGEKRRVDSHTTIVIHSRSITPFTWGRWIVISRRDLETNAEMLLAHENAHKGAVHWLDLLIGRLLACVDWYWPSAWLLIRDLSAVHEYQADRLVVNGGNDATAYQMLLIRKGTSGMFSNIVNPFNYKSLKNRITMMQKKQSSTRSRMRCLVMLPAAAVAVLFSTAPALASAVKSAMPVESPKSENIETAELVRVLEERPVDSAIPQQETTSHGDITEPTEVSEEPVAVENDDRQVLLDGMLNISKVNKPLFVVDGIITSESDFSNLVKDNILHISVNMSSDAVKKYGEAAKNGAVEVYTNDATDEMKEKLAEHKEMIDKENPRVRVRNVESPTANSEDKLSGLQDNLKYIVDAKPATYEQVKQLDPQTIEGVKVVKGEQATQLFGTDTANGVAVIQTKAFAAEQAKLDQNVAKFPGGDAAMYQFLARNIRYPEEAAKKDIQGRVIVQFKVQKDGSITDAKVARGVDPLLDAEAVRVIESMPKFVPATQDGEPVAVWQTMPISFKLSSKGTKSLKK